MDKSLSISSINKGYIGDPDHMHESHTLIKKSSSTTTDTIDGVPTTYTQTPDLSS